MLASYTMTGTLKTDRLVRLDNPVSLPNRRVRITLEPLLPEERTGKTLIAWIRVIRADLKNKEHGFRTKEEIDRQIREERDSWCD